LLEAILQAQFQLEYADPGELTVCLDRLNALEDLVTWQPVIVLQGTGSPINLVDYLTAGPGRRFYRFVPVP
jgi:hypothetical protein